MQNSTVALKTLLAVLIGVLASAGSSVFAEIEEEEIIRRFAEKESEFRDVWQQYTYQQRILFQVLSSAGTPREQREMIVEVYFNSQGERETRVISDRGRLESVRVSPEDIEDAVSRQPFVLTTDDLEDYDIDYKGEEQVDELYTYVFDIEPKEMRRGERYFKGRIWVDDLDFQIVMTRGKIVPDYRDNKFPEFETIRQQVDGEYWFPTWTEADDVLTFGGGWGGSRRVRVRQLITYGSFERFQVGTSIQYGGVADEEESEADDSAPKAPEEPSEPTPEPEGPRR